MMIDSGLYVKVNEPVFSGSIPYRYPIYLTFVEYAGFRKAVISWNSVCNISISIAMIWRNP
jgi:hypothetical protein